MFNVNRVTLLGNVTRDPEAFTTKSGRPLSVIGFATNRSWKDAEGKLCKDVEFHRLVCFGSLAEFSAGRVEKGAPLYVEGRLHTAHWQAADGKDASRTEIVVDRLVLLSKLPKGGVDAAERGDEIDENEAAA